MDVLTGLFFLMKAVSFRLPDLDKAGKPGKYVNITVLYSAFLPTEVST